MKHIMGPNSHSKLTNVQDDDIQPNAVDLRIDKVFWIEPKAFIVSEEEKKHHSHDRSRNHDHSKRHRGHGKEKYSFF